MNPQDPLANLQPLREPQLIGWWPLAPGWWLLLALVLLGLAAAIYLALHYYRKNAYRRRALAQLAALQAGQLDADDQELTVSTVNALLKSVALHAYPRRQVAREYGEAWRDFLNSSLAPADQFEASFAFAGYQAGHTELDTARLYRCARAWIKQHRVAR